MVECDALTDQRVAADVADLIEDSIVTHCLPLGALVFGRPTRQIYAISTTFSQERRMDLYGAVAMPYTSSICTPSKRAGLYQTHLERTAASS